MTKIHLLFLLVGVIIQGCTKWPRKVPDTLGSPNNAPSYGYTPIDPLPVQLTAPPATPTDSKNQMMLEKFPDETVRLAIGQFQANGSISFGPAKIGTAGNSYVVVLDYIKFDTKSLGVEITQSREESGRESRNASRNDQNPSLLVPVYIGIGLRLTANVTVREGTVDLGNLLALGVSAQTKQIFGTLVIQTLGISGEGVSGIIPLPSEINQTSVQNAIQSLGAIRANIYSDKTKISPRVVGIYNNLGGGQETINSFINSLLKNPVQL